MAPPFTRTQESILNSPYESAPAVSSHRQAGALLLIHSRRGNLYGVSTLAGILLQITGLFFGIFLTPPYVQCSSSFIV